MADFKFELNHAGLVELMKSKEMQSVLAEYGGQVASAAGSGYKSQRVMSGDRAKVFVKANTKQAISDNFKNNTLLKALGGSTK